MAERGRPQRVRPGEPGYPPSLLDLSDPPAELFVRGALPMSVAIAIVGSRAATDYGVRMAQRLACDLAGLGIVIVSGLARGIDAAAHRGALEAGRPTVAVLPGSLAPVSPAHHADLADAVEQSGAVVAEWERDRPPTPGLFLHRNRLIAALAAATVVVESAERSGALSTARVARELGRPVLAVPGDCDRPTSRGVHGLLRGGARVCEGAGDVLAAIGLAGRAPARPRSRRRATVAATAPAAMVTISTAAPPATDSARLAAALAPSPAALEALVARSGVPVERALAALLELEWSGVATAHPGQRWSLRSGAA